MESVLIPLFCGLVLGYGLLRLFWSKPWNLIWVLIRRVVAASGANLLLVDEKGRLVEASREALRLFGLSREGLKRLGLLDLIADGPDQDAKAVLDRLLGGDGLVEFQAQGPAGRRLTVDAASTALPATTGRGFSLNLRDHTALKEAQASLTQSELFHRCLVENLHEVVTVLDMKERVRFVSPSIERVLGYKPEELLGKTGDGRLHPEDHPRLRKFFRSVVENPGVMHANEYRSLHKDGQYRHVRAFCKFLPQGIPGLPEACVMVTYHDISPWREAEKRLEASEKFYRSLMENSLDGVSVVGLDNTVIYHSPSITRITGLDPERRKGKNVFENIPPEERGRISRFLADATKEPGRTFELEFRAANPEGQERHFEALVQFNMQSLGQPAFIVNYRDVSERRAAQKQLLRFERLATVGEMAAGLAHELRNPLLALSATTENLLGEQGFSPAQRADLEIILSQCRRMRELLEVTLGARAGQAPKPLPVDLAPLLEEALVLARRHFGPGHEKIEVRTLASQGLPPVLGDAAQLQQVFLNLLLNAFQAMPKGGLLTLEALLDRGQVRLSVKDSGLGLAEMELERVFEPFYTTKPNGSGIGLPVSRRIVEAHGGRIVPERLQQGTAFHVWLPSAARQEAMA